MGEAQDGRSGLVFPDDSEVSPVKQCLQYAGFSRDDQEWLIRVFERPDCFGDRSGDAVFKDEFTGYFEYFLSVVVEQLGESDQTEKDRQTRLSLLLSFLLGFGPIYSEVVRPNVKLVKSSREWIIPAWVGEFQRQAKFCARRLDWRKLIEIRDAHAFLFFDLIPFLFPQGVPLEQVVDLDLLHPIQRQGWFNNEDPEQIEFWLIWRFRNNGERCDTISLNTLLQAFSSFPEDVLGDKIHGLLHAIGYVLNNGPTSGNERLDALNDGWQVVVQELIPFMELLDEKEPESSQERSSLLKAWWRLSVVIYSRSMGGLASDLSDELRNRLVASAAKHLGMLRKVLRETPEDFERKDSTGAPVYDFYDKAFEVLLIFSTPWQCLKSLLLTFTEMTVPAVASDISHWPGSDGEAPPHPYSQIPYWIGISMYPQNLRSELNRDPHLQELREEFARFCLERLKTKKNGVDRKNKVSNYADGDFVEPRSIWRQCYVQALTALRVNPGGRAHRTLFWLSKNDPDEKVCEFAKRAHKQIRHLNRNKPNLDRGTSPRRPLFEAFWWLRQAHLLALGKEIDHAGAMRTRRSELYRTREKSDNKSSDQK
ncbi:MAG: hypothetical protein OXU23_11445 [Candidatus Poribacteria bacterium]|nr:hypothetical protein [Candidatus Poribacteria bacterium]